ncbi:MAG: DUF928 domain-containing protein [Cyanobacteriota bacterium]
MKVTIKILLLAILLFLISSNSYAQEKQKNNTFSRKLPPILSRGGIRDIADFITPNDSVIYEASPIFEWNKPVCDSKAPCIVIIEQPAQNGADEDIIYEDEEVKSNIFILSKDKVELEPGFVYSIEVVSDKEKSSEKASSKIYFYKLTDKEKDSISKDLLGAQNQKAKLDVFIENGIWFDTVEQLNSMLEKLPEDKDLKAIKETIYKK